MGYEYLCLGESCLVGIKMVPTVTEKMDILYSGCRCGLLAFLCLPLRSSTARLGEFASILMSFFTGHHTVPVRTGNGLAQGLHIC